jgi:biotin synthase
LRQFDGETSRRSAVKKTGSPGHSDGDKLRHDWTLEQAQAIYAQPFNDLIYQAQGVHRRQFDPNAVQISTLLSVKTGACPEDCAYCPQSAHYAPGRQAEALLSVEAVVEAARAAKANGATRFCMGAAWRNPKDKDLELVFDMISGVRALGLETCATLGMLTRTQARKLKQAGLDFYNHNLDTSPEFYPEIISTRTYADRLETLEHVRAAGLKVCCGGIIGMGEGTEDRIGLFLQLANLETHPESVPINLLVQVEGTPLHGSAPLDPLEFVRVVALARIMMPASYVRLSAGREGMSAETQALCFLAGANSIFYGDKLLTTPNPAASADRALFERLGVHAEGSASTAAGIG